MSIKSYQEYLTCALDTNRAEYVCGECGKPVCDEHYTENNTFTGSFSTDAWEMAGLILLLLIGIPIIFLVLAPELIGSIRRALIPGQPFFLRTPLVHSSILLGLMLLLKIWYRTTEGSLGYEPLVRKETTQITCSECNERKNRLKPVEYGLLGFAALFVVVGTWMMVTGPNAGMLRLVAIGFGLYLVRDEIATIIESIS